MRQHNSTIRVNKKNLDCGHFDFEFSRGRCKQCATVQNVLAKDEKEFVPVEDLSGLIDDADVLVSRYVRLSASDENGWLTCFTCPSVLQWKDVDAGHFVKRGCLFLRHDLRNVKQQCRVCNRHKDGKAAIFSVNLEKEQPGIVEELLHESRIVHDVTREELRAIISDMTVKLSKLKPKCLND
jgi:NinG protein